MTTNMNFGPEWMRPAAPKRSNTFDSQNLRLLHSGSVEPNDRVNTSLTSISSLMSNHSSSLQHNFNNGLNGEHLKNSDDKGLSLVETPYKYSSAFMLSLYKPVDMPSEFERHDYVAVEESQVPLSFVPLSGEEKKLLSGPVHSGSSQERGSNNGQRNNSNHMYSSPVQSPTSENPSGVPSRMGAPRSKGRMHDHFSQQDIKRHDYGLDTSRQREWTEDHTTNLSYESEQEETPSWDSVSQNNIGTFDSNGVFRASSAEETELEPIQDSQGGLNGSRELTGKDIRYPNPADTFVNSSAATITTTTFSGDGLGMQNDVGGPASLFGGHETRRPTTQHKWFYRDPMGNPLGPFDAHDMQTWFDAGYLSPNFLVRRDDEAQFDTLAWMVRKSGNHDKPFLANYYTPRSRTSPDPLELGSLPPRSRGLDSLHQHISATTTANSLVSAAGLELSRGGNILSHGAGRLGQLNVSPNYLPQQVGQSPSSPHSPTVFQGHSYSGFGSSLLANRESALHWSEIPRTPSSLNSSQVDFFGAGDVQGTTPALRQEQRQHLMNQILASDLGSSGFYDYPRTIAEQRSQQQQYHQQQKQQQQEQRYIQILQLQQQQQLQFQQQFQQQQALLLQQRQQFQEFQEFQQEQDEFSRHRELQHIRVIDPTNQDRQQTGFSGIPTDKILVRSSVPEECDSILYNTTAEALILPLSRMQMKHSVPMQPSPVLSSSESTSELPTEPVLLRHKLQDEEIRRPQQTRDSREQAKGQDGRASAPSWGFGQPYAGGPKRMAPMKNVNPNTGEAISSKSETTTASRTSDSSSPPSRGGATAVSKKSLREIQLEEEDALKKTEGLVTARTTGVKTWTSTSPQRTMVKMRASTSTASAAPSPVPSATSSSTTRHQQQQHQGRETSRQAKNTSATTSMPSVASTRTPAAAITDTERVIKAEDVLKPPSEDFMQWCRQSLRNLSNGVNADEILQMLVSFPLDEGSSEIIQDIIYANSASMDGRRFAEDFMKRRKDDIAGKLTMTIPVMRSATHGETTFKVVTKKGKKKTAV